MFSFQQHNAISASLQSVPVDLRTMSDENTYVLQHGNNLSTNQEFRLLFLSM